MAKTFSQFTLYTPYPLELLGNLLLVKLVNSVKTALKNQLTISKTYLFTDSKICLAWISATGKEFNTFVENRIQDIRNLSNINDWHYCPTSENTADLISKSIRHPINAILSSMWTNGPQFIRSKTFPENNIALSPTEALEEVKQQKVLQTRMMNELQNSKLL